jgi:predicted nucleotidyltransferase
MGCSPKFLPEKPFIPKVSIVIFANSMKKSEILQTLAAHRDELTQMGVKTMAVFGSVARDEARLDSDVDILVEFQGPATFNGYMDLKFFLEDLLGRSVDLVTRKSIRPRLKTSIEREALYVQGLSAVS